MEEDNDPLDNDPLDNDPLDNALSSRRMPHGRSGNRSGGNKGKSRGKGGKTAVFSPLRTLGYYEVHLGAGNKRAQQQTEDKASLTSWLEIHELTEGDDGLLGTFSLRDQAGHISGMCVLAGSRKVLQANVDSLEEEEEESEDDDDDNVDEEEAEVEEDDVSDNDKTALELSDERHNRRIQAFEKNSFRNPKFWMRWKGRVEARPDPDSSRADVEAQTDSAASVQSDSGYLVFASNDCEKYEGTITCPGLGWDNLKMQGWKTRSKSTPCPIEWGDLGQ